MPKAVRFDRYGETEVLRVEDVPRPTPGPGQALVRVRAAGINPGEAAIRRGLFAEQWPATFPSGQGSDFAGTVEEIGEGVYGLSVGEEVIGFSNRRASQAEYVAEDASQLTPKPKGLPWEVAGALFVAGTTAYASVRAVALKAGDVVAVSGASGGVGTLTVQLARLTGATVLGIASEGRREWLQSKGVTPVTYGDGLEDRLKEASGGRLSAFIDTFGGDYVDTAIRLGVQPARINTIINFEAVKKYGVKAEGGSEAAEAHTLALLAGLLDQGLIELPIARTFPLEAVQDAFRELEQHHTFGKIVLVP